MDKERTTGGFLEFVSNNAGKIGATVAVVAGVGIGIAAYMSTQEEVNQSKKASTAPASKAGSYAALKIPAQLQPQINMIAQRVQAELAQGNVLSAQTVITIIQLTGEMASDEFVRIFSQGRTQRRAIGVSDVAKYTKCIMDTTTSLEQLMDSSVNSLVTSLGVDIQQYQNSCEHWASMDPQFGMMAMGQMEMLKARVPSSSAVVDRQKLIEYFKYLVEQLPQLKIEKKGDIPVQMVKKTMLDDMAFDAFGIEEEDVLKYIKSQGPAAMGDAELFGLLQSYQTLLQQDLAKEMGM
jgi:hypothetical protein